MASDDFSDHQQRLLDETTEDVETADGILSVPNKPDEWKAAKLARIVHAYDRSIAHNLKAFNAQGYLAILNAYTDTITKLGKNSGDAASGDSPSDGGAAGDAEVLDEGLMAEAFSASHHAPRDGEEKADGVDSGVSTEDSVSR